jgi:CRISPR-associated protein Csm1
MTETASHAIALRSIAESPGGASLVGLWVSGIQRFIFDVPTKHAGLEVKARSFLVALLPKVLAWRARRAASLGDPHEVMVAAGRATLLVPAAKVEAVRRKLIEDVRWLRDETGDELAVDVAVYPVGARESLSDALRALDGRLGRAWLRRAEGEGDAFWEPKEPAEDQQVDPEQETPFAALGRMLRGKAPRVAAIAVVDAGAEREGDRRWLRVLGRDGLDVAVGDAIESLPEVDGAPRLLLRLDEKEPPPARLPDETASFPLAGTWIAPDGDGVLEFKGLAARSEGDAKLGVLRLDLDSLGAAFDAVVRDKQGDEALDARLMLSDAVRHACGPVADKVTWSGESPRPVQWILAGGDDLFLVGAWSEIVDVSLELRAAIVPLLRKKVRELATKEAADKLDLSGGIVLAHFGVPLAHLADQADHQEHLAKGKRVTCTHDAEKAAVSWGGVVMGWDDWRLVVALGKELGDAIEDGSVPRSILRRLIGIHTLWDRARKALEDDEPRQAAETSKRQWLWAYELGRARGGLDEREGAALVERLSRLALEDLDTETGKRTERPAAAWLGIVAEIAHRRTRGRGEERA